jgi:hypothetical protein
MNDKDKKLELNNGCYKSSHSISGMVLKYGSLLIDRENLSDPCHTRAWTNQKPVPFSPGQVTPKTFFTRGPLACHT